MLAQLNHRLELWASGWAIRRQGLDPLGVTLKRRRIYILPTRFGLIFGALLFAMLIGSMNYGASLGFALTFLLAGLGLVIMHHCHNNLLATQIRFAGTQAVFAGEDARFRIGLINKSEVARYELELALGGRRFGPVDLEPDDDEIVVLRAPTESRGWSRIPPFIVQTRHPGCLFRAWTWVRMETRCLVYPRPAPPGRPIPTSLTAVGSRARSNLGDADFAALKAASPGDPPGRIAWKAYARNEELLLKQFSGGDEQPFLLDWDSLPDLGVEARLEQLCRWCLDAEEQRRGYGLRLPKALIAVGHGTAHLQECLRALALFEQR